MCKTMRMETPMDILISIIHEIGSSYPGLTWDTITRDCKDYVMACGTCQRMPRVACYDRIPITAIPGYQLSYFNTFSVTFCSDSARPEITSHPVFDPSGFEHNISYCIPITVFNCKVQL